MNIYLIEIGILLLGSALLGFLLHRAISSNGRKELKAMKQKDKDSTVSTKDEFQKQRTVSALETKIAHLEQRNSDLRILLTSAESEVVKAQALAKKNVELEERVRVLDQAMQRAGQVKKQDDAPRESTFQKQPTSPPVEPPKETPGIRLSTPKAPSEPDPYDLKQIEGIGPGIHEILSSEGINTFEELAGKTPEALSELLLKHGNKYKVHNPETWPAQAALARDGKWNMLREMQAKLKGGKPRNEQNEDL